MSYTPIVPLEGLGGWRFLQRTLDSQRAAFDASARNAREIEYFRENIAGADTAEKLVADRTLLKVALGAYGLGSEIDKRALMRKVLEEGTTDREALALRFSDPKFRELSFAFGYGDERGAQVGREGFAEQVIGRYRIRAFEEAVGAVDDSMRLALNFDRVVQTRAPAALSDDGFWLGVLGDPPLRAVFEGAFGLPSQFAALDIDQQVATMAERSERLIGSRDIADLATPEAREKVIRRFLLRQQINSGPSASAAGMGALQLLQSGSAGPSAIQNLLVSRF